MGIVLERPYFREKCEERPARCNMHVMLLGVSLATLILAGNHAPAKPLTHLVKTDLMVGKGATAAAGDLVVVHYAGKLVDGKEFDSSLKPDRTPFSFTLGAGEVIKGWDQGVAGMKVGGKRKLGIPYSLGYGVSGSGPIPAKSDLYFDVNLLAVVKKGHENEVIKKDLKVGKGAVAKDGMSVTIHYVGTFPDGKKFDSSRDHGQPFTFPLGGHRVVPGFEVAVRGMKVGGKRKVTIPPALGYGAQGAGAAIPGNMVLVFEIELLGVK